MRRAIRDITFSEFIKLNIDKYMGDFIPKDIQQLEFNNYTDDYVDLLMQKIFPFDEVFNDINNRGASEVEVYEFTFSSDKNLLFKELPWLESFISFMVEEYYFLAIAYPYLIKVDNEYVFRFPYRTVTEEDDKETKDGPNGIDFTPFEENVLFFKHHFYKEKISDELISIIAKTMLLDNAAVVE